MTTGLETATELANDIRAGRTTVAQATETLLDRISTVNPTINAVSELDAPAARAQAERVDAAIDRGEDLGPLAGVPMTVKDALHATGLRTTWGNPEFADGIAAQDATVVRRLRDAGAVIVGKSNVAMMLQDFGQTDNPIHGTTNNPWNTAHSVGGSSGGAAAALAAGLSYLEYGSDLVGSIRLPAAYCGVYGLKPTVGTVPTTGLQPPGPFGPLSDPTALSCLGPMARSAEDLRLALRATGGPERPASLANRWQPAPPRAERLPGFRVGVVLDDPRCPVTTEVGDLLSNAVDTLIGAGVTVQTGWPEGIDPGRVAESFGVQVAAFFALLDPDGSLDGLDFAAQERFRFATRAAWEDYFTDVDLFLCPVAFGTAFPHDQRPFEQRTIETADGVRDYADQPFWTTHASLPGLPALSAPVGLSRAGMPVGMQVVGPMHEDDAALTFAELMADVIGGFTPPPLAEPGGGDRRQQMKAGTR